MSADHVVWNGQSGTYRLSGAVVVRRGGVVLRAATATVNPDTGEVQANGDVLLVDATRAVRADGIHAFLDGPFEATGVTAFFKDKPLDPIHIASLAEARPGRNRLTFSADRVEGEDERHFTLRGTRFTLCDCGEGKAPTWEIASRRAKVADDRIALSWPVFYVTPRFLLVQRPVPVLALPWLSLPLTERQTGLLFPEVGTRGTTGWYLGQPAYLTLGRSADLTFTPEYFFGPNSPHSPGGAVKGPGARLEARWALAPRAEGMLELHLLDDFDREHLRSGDTGGSGLRLSLEGNHAQDLGASTRLVAHLSLSQDAFMFRDFHGLGLPGDAFYSRSDVLLSRRADALVLEAGAMYLEPLGPADQERPGAPSWFGLHLPAAQRWPSAALSLLPLSLGPLEVEGRAGVSRYAPLVGHRGLLLATDRGASQTTCPDLSAATCSPRPGVVIGLGPAEAPEPDPSTRVITSVLALPREAVTRAEGRLQVAAPMVLGGTVSVEPFLRGAMNGYAFDARPSAAAAWGLAGLAASLELSRRFGALEHRVVPRLDILAGTAAWQENPGDPFPAYDLWDRIDSRRSVPVAPGLVLPVAQKFSAAPDGAYTQLRAEIENRLDAGPKGHLVLRVGQDVDLRAGRLAESWGSLGAVKGPFVADAGARVLTGGQRPPVPPGWRSSWLDRYTELFASASIHDGRGDAVHASIRSLGPGAVGAQAAGVDALFDLRPTGTPPDATIDAGARATLGGAALDYDAKLVAREYPAIQCSNGRTRSMGALRPSQQTAVLSWDSPCHCFVARVRASLDACGVPSLGFDVDLSRILQGGPGRGR